MSRSCRWSTTCSGFTGSLCEVDGGVGRSSEPGIAPLTDVRGSDARVGFGRVGWSMADSGMERGSATLRDMSHNETLSARRASMAATWALTREIVLVPSGLPIPIAGTDQAHGHHAHPEHRYLAGACEAESLLVFDPGEGWTLFAPVAGTEERVWSGDRTALEQLQAISGLDSVRPSAELPAWLERRRGETFAVIGNDDIRHQPEAYGVATWRSLELDIAESLSARLSDQVSEQRRAKDSAELR